MYQDLYQHFLSKHKNELHFTAHSHHFWPDVTREAQLQYWDDSATYVDQKWSYFFENKIPKVQSLICEILGVDHPEQVTFAPNTHELVYRLFSSLNTNKPLNILTTDSEFYSWQRQILRLQENSNYQVTFVPTEPLDSFESRFAESIQEKSWDLIFLSHVFFNSGYVVDSLENLVDATMPKSKNALFIIDGYHGFMAIPTILNKIQHRIFYVAGSYKYAQGGEGCCFLISPPGCQLRPQQTGWFASLSDLNQYKNQVSYSNDGLRWAGSTMDFSALYRLEATLSLFKQKKITVSQIHEHVQKVQRYFMTQVSALNHSDLNLNNLLNMPWSNRGHFLTFELEDELRCHDLVFRLAQNKIFTDSRKNRLRFGFSLIHDCDFKLKIN